MNRRDLLRKSLKGASFTVAGLAMASVGKAAGGQCLLTPSQTEGPFYPVEDQPDKDTDLVYVRGSKNPATGEVIFVQGIVSDSRCRPISGALVEIWQACASGRYNHPSDP